MADENPPRPRSPLGFLLFGAGGILLGAVGFAWDDFAVDWQHVRETIPLHGALAYLAAALELAGGAALFRHGTARAGAGLLALVYLVFVLMWAGEIAAGPGVWGSWANLSEELSIVIGGAAIFAYLSPDGSPWQVKPQVLTRLYGLCPITFGMTHLMNIAGCADWVPKWLPFGGAFWVAATGTCFLLASVAILTGILAGLASRLNAIMIVGFELLIWIPKLAAAPRDHFTWSANGISLAMCGAAWAVADLINMRPRPGTPQA
jgi:hypothetical protein